MPELTEDFVANPVPITIIDQLEMVDISHDEHERSPKTHGAFDFPRKLLFEKPAAPAPGEFVDRGENPVIGHGQLQRGGETHDATRGGEMSPELLSLWLSGHAVVCARAPCFTGQGSILWANKHDMRGSSGMQLARSPNELDAVCKQHRVDSLQVSEGFVGSSDYVDIDVRVTQQFTEPLPCSG